MVLFQLLFVIFSSSFLDYFLSLSFSFYSRPASLLHKQPQTEHFPCSSFSLFVSCFVVLLLLFLSFFPVVGRCLSFSWSFFFGFVVFQFPEKKNTRENTLSTF